ncbi:hypothetical protein KY329_05675, partial [Candidatus Woesearchaeota archaeon]|nr:hypothetical protein [Candidatus Woesearchaeota archaeon]
QFIEYLDQHSDRIQYVMLDNCGGGLICADDYCKNLTAQIIQKLDSGFRKVFDKQEGRCWYGIWTT